MTPQEIFTTGIPQKIANNLEKVRSINAVYQFKITGDNGGDWVMDLTVDSDNVREGTTDKPNCVVTMKDNDFVDLWSGKLAGPQAFMMGKLKISGDMSLAMKLTSVLS